MSGFEWIDARGVVQTIDTARPIEAEYESVKAQILALADELQSADGAIFNAAYEKTRLLRRRLIALSNDLERWNNACAEQIAIETARARGIIKDIGHRGAEMAQLHLCYRQYSQLPRGDNAEHEAQLNTLPSQAQIAVIQRAQLSGATDWMPSTFGAAHGWILKRPETNRESLPKTSATFEWVDGEGHHHQLRSMLPIEEEYISTARGLEALITTLDDAEPLQSRAMALENVNLAVGRVSILERDLERWSAFVLALARADAVDLLNTLKGG